MYYYQTASAIKIFIDFFDVSSLQSEYTKIEKLSKIDKWNKLQFRYTGKQENRGPGCSGCIKNCVTLKAVWVFPDNTITPCPQKHKGTIYQYMDPSLYYNDIPKAIQNCYQFHKVGE
jgi:hypothetical protein